MQARKQRRGEAYAGGLVEAFQNQNVVFMHMNNDFPLLADIPSNGLVTASNVAYHSGILQFVAVRNINAVKVGKRLRRVGRFPTREKDQRNLVFRSALGMSCQVVSAAPVWIEPIGVTLRVILPRHEVHVKSAYAAEIVTLILGSDKSIEIGDRQRLHSLFVKVGFGPHNLQSVGWGRLAAASGSG